MEVIAEDLKNIKLSPTLIIFLKCIHNKNNSYLLELHKITDVFIIAKHLQDKMLVKILDSELSCKSFEIRELKIINYFNNINPITIEYEINEVIEYFKTITGKTKISNTSTSNRKFIKSRLQEYKVQDLKDVIDLKYKEWRNDSVMRKYLRIETLFNDSKFQGYIGQLETNNSKSRTFTG